VVADWSAVAAVARVMTSGVVASVAVGPCVCVLSALSVVSAPAAIASARSQRPCLREGGSAAFVVRALV